MTAGSFVPGNFRQISLTFLLNLFSPDFIRMFLEIFFSKINFLEFPTKIRGFFLEVSLT